MSDIVVDDVTKTYGTVTALDGVTFRIPENGSFGLLGTNGAGKTTLFKLLIGHEDPDSGVLKIAGLTSADGASIRDKVGYVPEKASFPETFTGREILSFHADIRNVSSDAKSERIERALGMVGLTEEAKRRVGGYSKGMNRRLGLATVLISDPDVLLLDEPTSGLDPQGVASFHELIKSFSENRNITMVFSSHTLAEINQLCDRVAILHEGQLKQTGSVDELRRSLSDTVTVTVWISSPDAPDQLQRFLASHEAIRSCDQEGDRLDVECDRKQAYEVLTAIQKRIPLENFEVQQPGMEDVFLKSIRSDSVSDTASHSRNRH